MPDPFPIVDFRLHKPPVANADGTIPATVTGAKSVSGPGATDLGTLTTALHFTAGGHLTAAPAPSLIDLRHYCVRLVLRVTAPVSERANLFESASPACSLQLMPSSGRGQFRIVGWVHNQRNGWDGVDTANRSDLQLNTWLTLDFINDVDTVAIFVNGDLIAVSAFPDGTPVQSPLSDFVVGVFTDLKLWPFTGDIALVQIWNGIPVPLEQALDDSRGTSEWLIRLKQNTLLPNMSLGTPQGDITFDAPSRMSLQRFTNATIGYGSGLPAAFEMHGAIRDRWERARGLSKLLGPLLSDESDTRASGGRRNLFEQGAIYWSRQTGAWEIVGRPSIDYEQMQGSLSVLGLPVAAPEKIPGGTRQQFQRGQLYYRTGATRAYEVHGAILEHYLAIGGPASWGYPVSDEEDVRLAPSNMIAPPPTGARQSRFEWQGCTILWSAAAGAHEVHGAIRDAYLNSGGPGVPNDDQTNGLGLPLTDEVDLPVWAGFGRFNAFQHGGIVWKGGAAQVCPAFRIKLGLVQTEEDEGFGQGQNDLYFRINLSRNGTTIFVARVPNRGSFGGDNSYDLDLLLDPLIVPNDPEQRLELSVEVWDEDDTSGDDHLGTLTKELNISNAWGLFENSTGNFVATGLDEVKRFEWQVQPRQPPSAVRDFWNTINQPTPTLIYDQYAAAFTDIDDDPEWTDPSDWAQREVFARRVKRIASNGNCFGFCTEALYAWFGHGMGLPLARFGVSDWETIRNTINIKQIYQIGSDALAHFQDQREDDMKPRAIFLETRQRFFAGDPCAICIWTNADFTGSGHCILPIAWDDSGPIWYITCFDPNGGNSTIQMSIDPNGETFRVTSGTTTYTGVMEFAPWSALNHRQCSPAWDPNMLLLGLLICVVGSDGSTSGFTDSTGDNLWMPDNDSGDQRSRIGQFAPLTSMNGSLDGEIAVRRVRPELELVFGTSDFLDTTIESATVKGHEATDTDSRYAAPMPLPPRLMRALKGASLSAETQQLTMRDLLHDQLSDKAFLEPEVVALGNWLRKQSTRRGPDFVHTLHGVRQGQFDYLTKWRLTATRMRSSIVRGEPHKLEAGGLTGRMPLYSLTAGRDKLISVEHTVRLGRSSDFAKITLGNLPSRAKLPLNIAVRAGLAAVDVLTAGERVDVSVLVETWRGTQRREQRFIAAMEGGIRLTPTLHESGAVLKSARIEKMFGEASIATFIKPSI